MAQCLSNREIYERGIRGEAISIEVEFPHECGVHRWKHDTPEDCWNENLDDAYENLCSEAKCEFEE